MIYLSRVRLSRDPQVAALDALLDPAQGGARADAHHRLIWSLFAGDPTAERDFLWRAEGEGAFIVQSVCPPQTSPLFEPPEIREHAPDLRPGDRLSYLLRANATRDLRGEKRNRVDIVMHRLHGLPKADRNARRLDLAAEAASEWMAGQGARAGFEALRTQVQHYQTLTLPGHRGKRRGEPRFGILDLTGEIAVTDPKAFLAKLAQGFGRAKGFGCGLMLIRRA
ncbi:MAG: type I-E CRISPR-associated protein Cas6/Cse3/CasE [Confluentimicrobium sp.]|jgi:CRISPR system Cascade subunit CasE|uniref:CRISPR system Cascade subunit CasE n=1 Tax=Actibacterium naphthalenivorans TaxID=1614693 RepID=A0A840CFX3_9RHOB|nr:MULTISPECIES: type I-E CRISPR-associated protein Cas6/Cse3/CasE [Actibacterium]ALG89310.1 CRISPR-associated protein Cse3 [Actibacterium sp. EMB200-NS6]KGB83117.1 CRISPR-associated protein Cse3 [Rhodovulum sp. NI22]MBB4021087.1 CRISPR system Cascade subunit CasE [Actibacterium naphthalenivorans]MBC56344.1 type I-E CRISPR-associated protein Cas6/Cse3/CasE [Actibacterium sp.]|tara:strand:+ start:1952 stop:2623 length:672 start_codon:yes stop_codon:yes gene_type:complete